MCAATKHRQEGCLQADAQTIVVLFQGQVELPAEIEEMKSCFTQQKVKNHPQNVQWKG
jgi:hypothetical protein